MERGEMLENEPIAFINAQRARRVPTWKKNMPNSFQNSIVELTRADLLVIIRHMDDAIQRLSTRLTANPKNPAVRSEHFLLVEARNRITAQTPQVGWITILQSHAAPEDGAQPVGPVVVFLKRHLAENTWALIDGNGRPASPGPFTTEDEAIEWAKRQGYDVFSRNGGVRL